MTTSELELSPFRRALSRGAIHGWSLASQSLSSFTTLAITVIAGRALGPGGLGQVTVALAAYVAVSGLVRGSIVEPLLAVSSSETPSVQRTMTQSALTLVLTVSALGGIAMLTLGWMLWASVGPGLVVMSAWVVPATLVELWRGVLFRDERPGRATLLHVLWMGTLLGLAPLALRHKSAAAAVATWGSGALVATAWGALTVRQKPSGLRPTGAFLQRVRTLAVPKGASFATQALGWQAILFLLAALLSLEALGDFRGAETLFAPLTLLVPAVTLSVLPQLARLTTRSHDLAERWAKRISAAAAVVVGTYLLTAAIFGQRLVHAAFGEGFDGVTRLLLPIGVGQLAIALGLGAGLLLNAREQGKQLLHASLVQALSATVLVASLAPTGGLIAAAWGVAASAGMGALVRVHYAFGRGRQLGTARGMSR